MQLNFFSKDYLPYSDKRKVYGNKILPFLMPPIIEIDLPEDFEYLEYEIATKGSLLLTYLKKHFKRHRI